MRLPKPLGFLLLIAGLPATILSQAPPQPVNAQYVGSAVCKTCHPAIYERWSKTRMANVVRDPKVHPDAILPDLSKPDPLVKFTKDDIAFVYGSKWKQRYFTKKGDDYYPLRRAVGHHPQIWRAYMVAPKHRLVGAVLSGRQHAAPHRPALRRLPFGELQHPDQNGHGVECGLREVPRARQRARGEALADQYR